MAIDPNLMRGKFMSMGGHIPGYYPGQGRRSGFEAFTKGLFETVEPIIQERADRFQAWADMELANVKPMEAIEYKKLEDEYRQKKMRFLMGGPAEQAMIMSEMQQDKRDVDTMKSVKQNIARLSKDGENGFKDNIGWQASQQAESLVSASQLPPVRDAKGNLGYMVWDPDKNKNIFMSFPEVNNLLQEVSRDAKTANAVSGMVTRNGQESLRLGYENTLYDWEGNYKKNANTIVKNGDLTTLNQFQNLPGRVFRDDFISMLTGLDEEALGRMHEGAKMKDFLALGRGDEKLLRERIARLDPNEDGDPDSISPEDAAAIYEGLVKDKKMNQEYLSAYLTNLGEDQWLYMRNFRWDAPQQHAQSFGDQVDGIYSGPKGDKNHKYKFIGDQWHAKGGEHKDWTPITNENVLNWLNENIQNPTKHSAITSSKNTPSDTPGFTPWAGTSDKPSSALTDFYENDPRGALNEAGQESFNTWLAGQKNRLKDKPKEWKKFQQQDLGALWKSEYDEDRFYGEDRSVVNKDHIEAFINDGELHEDTFGADNTTLELYNKIRDLEKKNKKKFDKEERRELVTRHLNFDWEKGEHPSSKSNVTFSSEKAQGYKNGTLEIPQITSKHTRKDDQNVVPILNKLYRGWGIEWKKTGTLLSDAITAIFPDGEKVEWKIDAPLTIKGDIKTADEINAEVKKRIDAHLSTAKNQDWNTLTNN
tara:strand:+ start:84 stop:2195 length:2112 start_codon:yes stop_codon:yes gene_type:complete